MHIDTGPFDLHNIDVYEPVDHVFTKPLTTCVMNGVAIHVRDSRCELVADAVCWFVVPSLEAQEWLLNLALLTASFKE